MSGRPPRFAWVLNLDAELELARPGYTPRARLLSQLVEFGAESRRLLGPDDVLVSPSPGAERGLTSAEASDFIGRAWCPTPRALAALALAGVRPEPHPPVEVLRRVNHRRFAAELGGLERQRYVAELAELDAELRRAERPLLLKRPLAFAGRGQLRVYARARITAKEWSWIEASFRSDGLVVEPLVLPTLELSLHGFVWRDRRFELGTPCVQEVSDRGVFRNVRRAGAGELTRGEHEALFARAEQVATALAAAGYYGPFGIDAYRYELDGRTGFCSLGEINARYTMGFVVGFPRHPSELVP